MSSTPNTAQPTNPSPTSRPSSTATSSTQDYAQHSATSSATDGLSSTFLKDSDDDLSDAPESPIDSTQLSTSPTSPPLLTSLTNSDSDSDLSDAPDSPVWPEGSATTRSDSDSDSDFSDTPKSNSHWASAYRSGPPYCTERDCPIRKALRRHYQGPYRHKGELPLTNETIFRSSNPPPHVWDSWTKIQSRDRSSTVEDDWNVLGFVRWHVDNRNTSLLRR
ncbi:hypothetical protein IMSHALPRED_007022 [Imshaugia aleurites]|uniref:Uncharacterized protein n=1 Tax=Imshaugia aleurites TaxID=172621 RepID=A0A8H3FLE3_9LECA|nr:hypothetical protein IMSHALPRED_007022 [Imshaugia aleurites]